MYVIFDLDGTLYDTFPQIFAIYQQIREEFKLPPLDPDICRRQFQSTDWKKLYLSLGFSNGNVNQAIARFVELDAEMKMPQFIPGARDALLQAFMQYGQERVFFLTNHRRKGVEQRFARDSLSKCMPQVITPYQGKALELEILAKRAGEETVYIGDLVSDGCACQEARERGAHNLHFWAMTHEYGFNHPDDVREFVREHKEFAREVPSLALLTLYLSPF